ncbi:MAG: arginase family protein, partial [Anaerolineales bacterium]
AGLTRSGVDPPLIWFDAHGDFNTWETTPSGFLGGMPLAMLAGLGEQTILESLEIEPLPQERIILTDARDLDPGEKELVASSGITHLKDPLILMDTPLPGGPLWIHFDTDVVDPAYVPAQNYPAPDGISPEDLAQVFSYLAGSGRIAAVSLSSWAPDLPGAEESRDVSLALLQLLL